MVTGVEEDGTHAVQDSLVYPCNHLVGHFAVLHMAPPDQNVGVVEYLFGQFGNIIQGEGADLELVLELLLQHHVDALGIELLHFLVMALVEEFIINGNLDHGYPPVSAYLRISGRVAAATD